MPEKDLSIKEQRIRKITQLYYSRPDIQKAIFDFSQNREVVPRYFEGFGKRPDSLQYSGDIFEMVKKGATSFHCSEELWKDSMKLSTDLNEKQLNELRGGWDLLIDIDSKYIDYSKISAELIIHLLKFHGIKNVGVKFSGSKGLHIIIPWKAFPKKVHETKTSDMFPEWPRILTRYITEKINSQLIDKISDTLEEKKYGGIKKYIRKDIGQSIDLSPVNRQIIGVRKDWNKFEEGINNEKYKSDFLKKVMPDIILVSPRHLFRMPYSLHEKTALASVVIDKDKISEFQLTDADPLKVKPINFIPDCEEGEASELLVQSLDWYQENNKEEKQKKFESDFKPIKLEKLSDKNFPPCVQKILNGVADGKKRSLFVLINLFRSVGMEKEEIEKRIDDWNKKNETLLKQGYIQSQLIWSFRNKPILPSNCKEYYQGIGVCQPDDFCRLIKNPVNYIIRKQLRENNIGNGKSKKKTY